MFLLVGDQLGLKYTSWGRRVGGVLGREFVACSSEAIISMLPYPRWMRHRVRRGCCRTASGLHERRQECMLCMPEFDCDTWVLFTLKDSCTCSHVYVITFNSQMGGVVCRPWWLVDSCRLLLSLCVLSLFKFCSKLLLQNWWSALSSFQDVRVSDRAGHANPVVTEQMTDDTQRSPFLISSHSDLCCDHISSALATCWWGGALAGQGWSWSCPAPPAAWEICPAVREKQQWVTSGLQQWSGSCSEYLGFISNAPHRNCISDLPALLFGLKYCLKWYGDLLNVVCKLRVFFFYLFFFSWGHLAWATL